MLKITSLCLLTLAPLSGCGKMCGGSKGTRDTRNDTETAVTGSIAKAVANLQASSRTSTCDTQVHDAQLELARILDAKADEIAAYAQSHPPAKAYKRVKMGPIYVRERLQSPPTATVWESGDYGWSDYAASLEKIRDQPVNAKWVDLNSGVRAILMDDENRLLYSSNVYLRRQDYASLPRISAALAKCLADSTCEIPYFEPSERELVASNPDYKDLVTTRHDLSSLKKLVDQDYSYKSMHKNKGVEAQASGDLLLPLDPGPFAEVKDQLGKYITEVWSSPGRNLKINWTTSPVSGIEPYKLVLEDGPGGRSFVRYNPPTVHLFDDVRARSIAHEIGHVLGFPDYYYTTWHPDTCRYTDEYSPGDLMSSSEGAVTSGEWQALKAQYPVPSTFQPH